MLTFRSVSDSTR